MSYSCSKVVESDAEFEATKTAETKAESEGTTSSNTLISGGVVADVVTKYTEKKVILDKERAAKSGNGTASSTSPYPGGASPDVIIRD